MKKTINFRIFTLLSLVIGLIGCQTNTLPEGVPVENLIETGIPGFENIHATATFRENSFPEVLRCEDIHLDVIRPGFSWQKLQIGVTTFDDVIEILDSGESNVHISLIESVGILKFEANLERVDPNWDRLYACFIGDTLVTLRIPFENEYFPLDLSNIVEQYGKPDVVTWGHNYWHRSLIWLDLGMLVVVDLEFDENVVVYLFPPIEEEEFEDSWLNRILPKSIEGWGDPKIIDAGYDLGRLPLEREREDPWGFTDWWRINN